MTVSPENYASPLRKNERNQSIECGKLIASFFVVFIHAPFPGELGGLASCLGRFAVPMFFMITGYFNYQASSEAVGRRTKHLVKLLLIGTFANILYYCVITELEGGSTIAYLRAAIPDPIEVVNWILLHIHPYSGQLWYLNAAIACYLCFWVYVRFWDKQPISYGPFYMVCLNLFVLCFAFGMIIPAMEEATIYFSCRNGWFLGLPMFGLGLFVHEYQDRIFSRYPLSARNLLLLVVGGLLFSVLQWKTVGVSELPLGTFLAVVALVLFLVSHPKVPFCGKRAENVISTFGPISMWIYIFHLIILSVYDRFCQAAFAAVLGEGEPYIRPLIILGMSLLWAVLCERVQHWLKPLRKRK